MSLRKTKGEPLESLGDRGFSRFSSSSFLKGNLTKLRCAAGGASVLAGLLGIGGGVIMVPMMSKLARISVSRAAATSAYLLGVTAAGACLSHLSGGSLPATKAIYALGGVFLGAPLGVRFSRLIHEHHLERAFIVVLGLALTKVILKLWSITIG